jgi:Beta-glucosidase-related glycosidases
MKSKFIAGAAIAGMVLFSCTQKPIKLGSSSVEKVVAAMTPEEKVELLLGAGMSGYTGSTYPIPRLGIPAVVFSNKPERFNISPTLLASTWNVELVENVGKTMGKQGSEIGAHLLLEPAMNIERDSYYDDKFDFYSEDPVISGKIGAAMVRGIQFSGVGAALKYFLLNNQGTNHADRDNRITPRALREIYLKGFEIAVKESNPLTVVSSGNLINGINASTSKGLLRTVLRDEWGFNGMVISDWRENKSAIAQVKAESDLILTGDIKPYEETMAAINDGRIKMIEINRNVTHILNAILETRHFKDYDHHSNLALNTYQEALDEAIAEGTVLLKNNNHTLPLAPSVKRIAVYGESDAIAVILENAGYTVVKQAQNADISLITARSREDLDEIKLPSVCRTFQSSGKKAILILTGDDIIETSSWKNLPDAILLAWQAQPESYNAIADVICGKINPSGKLTVTFPKQYLKETLLTNPDPASYTEDIFVGYRYYDTFRKDVSYPFGFGLSYTSFDYKDVTIEKEKEKGNYAVTVNVTNTGKVAGKEVVQLYISAPINPDLPKPVKELKAFAKTRSLAPGESEIVTMKVNQMDLASFDESIGSWIVEPGNYRFLIGASSQHIKEMVLVKIAHSIEKKASNVLLPREPINTLTP